MSRPTNMELTLVFKNNCKLQQSAERIAGISRNVGSWANFLEMLAGGPPALMTATCEDGTVEQFKVAYYGDLSSESRFENL